MSLARHLRSLARALLRPPLRRRPDDLPRLRYAYPEYGAPTRYRVHHQIEQAAIAGLIAEAVPLTSPERLYDLSACDLLVLYRMPLAPRSMALLLLGRMRRIPVVFDSDDLTWDVRQRSYEYLDRHHNPATIARIVRTARRTAMMLRQVDALILSTPYLARQAGAITSRPAYVCLNAVSRELARRSDEALSQRSRSDAGELRIGYFSGHPRVHDEDLASIGPALATLLERFPRARLTLCGDVALPGELSHMIQRIERRTAVDWRELPAEIARVDINIAPLLDNPQRRSKSAVKYLEAALVAVPTVAARLEPYAEVVHEGRTALLAQEPAEWVAALAMLLESETLRFQIGSTARAHVLAEHTTDARAPRFAEIVDSILAGRQSRTSHNV